MISEVRGFIRIIDEATSAVAPVSATIPLGTEKGLYVHVVSTPGSSTAFSIVDKTAFVVGTSALVPTGGVFNDGLPAIASGLVAEARITSFRSLHVNTRDNSGNEIGILTNPFHVIVDSGAVTVTGSVTVSGTVAVSGVTGNVTVVQPTGTNLHVVVDSGAITVSGSVTVTGSVTVSGTVAVSAVAGNVTVVQPTGTNLHTVIDSGTTTVTQATGTNLHVVVDSGAITVSGTVAVSAVAGNVTVIGTSADNSANSTTKVSTLNSRANAAAPAWTEGNQVPLSVDLAGSLRTLINGNVTVIQPTGTNLHTVIDSGAVTVTGSVTVSGTVSISGSVTVVQSTGTSLHVVVDSGVITSITNTVIVTGTDADNAVNSTTKVPVIPARANAAAPAWTEGREVPLSVDLTGALRVSGASGGGVAQLQVRDAANVWTDIGYFAGDLNVPVQGRSSDNSANATTKIPTIPAKANAAFQVWTEGNQVPLSTDLSGAVRMLVTQGSNVAIVKTTSPVGTDARLVVGTIPRKEGQTLTTTPLAAFAEYNSGWFDSQASGTVYVTATALANVASQEGVGVSIEQSDVNNDENMVIQIEAHNVLPNEPKIIIGLIHQRYWRIRYFNGQAAQASFKLTVTESTVGNLESNLIHENEIIGLQTPETFVGIVGGQTTDNYYRAFRMDDDNRLLSGLPDLYSMFNEMLKELKLITLHLHNITEEEIDTYDVEGAG